ncbi:MAG: branched-chain amino acid ABC transporter permease [Acetobacteraceae bacterium]
MTERAIGVPSRVGAGLWLIAACVVVLAVAWPLLTTNRYLVTVATLIALNAIGASSLHLIIRTGLVSLAHAAFMGIGAYTAVLTLMRLGWPFPLNLLAGIAAPALVALIIGPILLRLSGKYFVLVTFLFGEIVRLTLTDWQSLTGGANGIFSIPPPMAALADPLPFYYFVLAVALLCVGLVARLLVCEFGRAIDAMREAEHLAECSGIPVTRFKVIAFVIGCALVGVQGGLQAYLLRYIDPTAFTFVQSLNLVVMNVVGGMEHLGGALIGTVLMVALPELLSGYVELQQILFGIILLAVMAAMPGGIVELYGRLRRPRAAVGNRAERQ